MSCQILKCDFQYFNFEVSLFKLPIIFYTHITHIYMQYTIDNRYE